MRNFNTKLVGPYKIRHVQATQGIAIRGGKTKLLTRVEVTKADHYVFSWPRWRSAYNWCKQQLEAAE